MKVLILHTSYLNLSAEDYVFSSEASALKDSGVSVDTIHLFNSDFQNLSTSDKVKSLRKNRNTEALITGKIETFKPDLVHIHNPNFQIPAGSYDLIYQLGIPIVQTLHNYRFFCSRGTLWRNGKDCFLCPKLKSTLPGIFHKCYRSSLKETAGLALFKTHQNYSGILNKISIFIALSEKQKELICEQGIDKSKVAVKPNFLASIPENKSEEKENFFIYASRLEEEKGIKVLLEAWRKKPKSDMSLHIVGQGSLKEYVDSFIERNPNLNIKCFPWLERNVLMDKISKAKLMIVPSLWEEPFGLVNIEAFAMGTPVLGTKKGALTTLIKPGINGLFFDSINSNDWAQTLTEIERKPQELMEMSKRARLSLESSSKKEENIKSLIGIYRSVLDA